MADQYTFSFDAPVTTAQVKRLLEQTHWANGRSEEAIGTMLRNTFSYLTVWQGDRLVGFARVLTDNVYRALIDDVVVDRELRNQDIGATMMRHITGRFGHVEELMLGCREEVVPFYERLGFTVDAHPHMAIKRPRPTEA
jgi:predicted GNAT family N-acyltransferase